MCNYLSCWYTFRHDTIEAPQLGLRERKKQQTRQLIAETARRLFGERGFERVTVAEIARAANVSEQTVFNYFPTKEDLVYWRLRVVRGRAAGDDPRARAGRVGARRVQALPARAARAARQARPGGARGLAALTRMITESPSLLAREEQIFAGYTASLAALLAGERGADAGDVEPWAAANAMMGVHRALVHYTRRRVVEGARHPSLGGEVRAQAEQALALLDQGLGGYAVRDPSHTPDAAASRA